MSENNHQVTVTNIDIPFGRMVGIIIKWTLASIPALIVAALVIAALGAVFSLVFGVAYHEFLRGHSPHY